MLFGALALQLLSLKIVEVHTLDISDSSRHLRSQSLEQKSAFIRALRKSNHTHHPSHSPTISYVPIILSLSPSSVSTIDDSGDDQADTSSLSHSPVAIPSLSPNFNGPVAPTISQSTQPPRGAIADVAPSSPSHNVSTTNHTSATTHSSTEGDSLTQSPEATKRPGSNQSPNSIKPIQSSTSPSSTPSTVPSATPFPTFEDVVSEPDSANAPTPLPTNKKPAAAMIKKPVSSSSSSSEKSATDSGENNETNNVETGDKDGDENVGNETDDQDENVDNESDDEADSAEEAKSSELGGDVETNNSITSPVPLLIPVPAPIPDTDPDATSTVDPIPTPTIAPTPTLAIAPTPTLAIAPTSTTVITPPTATPLRAPTPIIVPTPAGVVPTGKKRKSKAPTKSPAVDESTTNEAKPVSVTTPPPLTTSTVEPVNLSTKKPILKVHDTLKPTSLDQGSVESNDGTGDGSGEGTGGLAGNGLDDYVAPISYTSIYWNSVVVTILFFLLSLCFCRSMYNAIWVCIVHTFTPYRLVSTDELESAESEKGDFEMQSSFRSTSTTTAQKIPSSAREVEIQRFNRMAGGGDNGTNNSRSSFLGGTNKASGLKLQSKLNPFERSAEEKKETLSYSGPKPHVQEFSKDDIIYEDEVDEDDDVFNFSALAKKQPKVVAAPKPKLGGLKHVSKAK